MTDRDRFAEITEVAELMPDDPVVRFGLAGAYLDAGLAEDAVAEYREAIRLKPDYTAAYRGLGRALERAGRPHQAPASYGPVLDRAQEYTPPARRDPWAKCSSSSRDRGSARAPARPRVPPPAVTPRAERARGARLRGGGRVLLDVLSLPRRCGVPLGGGGERRQPALAAPLAPRRGHRAHVGAEGHAPVEEARVLREAPQGPAAPGGARAVSRLLRSDPRAAAGARLS